MNGYKKKEIEHKIQCTLSFWVSKDHKQAKVIHGFKASMWSVLGS